MERTTSRKKNHAIAALGLLLSLNPLFLGCQTVKTPEERIAKSSIPRELSKTTLPPYVLEPPDIVFVEVLEALPGRPISGERLIRPDGTITLGFYGDVYVTGLTMTEAKEKIVLHLRKFLSDDALGLFRENPETGKIEEVPPADSDRIFVDVASYNSKFFYVQGDVGVPGRWPVTGNETVLDALNYAGGLIPTAAPQNIRVVRPAPPGACCDQILPVNLAAIVNAGDTTTNYQLMPNDRIVVYRDPIVRFTVFLERVAAPFQIGVNAALTYAFTSRQIEILGSPLFGAATSGTTTNNTPSPSR